jgi:hypothetical protein
MDYYEFMYRIEHDDDSVLNLPESSIGDILDPWDEESCDDFFLGADPYIPLY